MMPYFNAGDIKFIDLEIFELFSFDLMGYDPSLQFDPRVMQRCANDWITVQRDLLRLYQTFAAPEISLASLDWRSPNVTAPETISFLRSSLVCAQKAVSYFDEQMQLSGANVTKIAQMTQTNVQQWIQSGMCGGGNSKSPKMNLKH